jgi:hypothetical protein
MCNPHTSVLYQAMSPAGNSIEHLMGVPSQRMSTLEVGPMLTRWCVVWVRGGQMRESAPQRQGATSRGRGWAEVAAQILRPGTNLLPQHGVLQLVSANPSPSSSSWSWKQCLHQPSCCCREHQRRLPACHNLRIVMAIGPYRIFLLMPVCIQRPSCSGWYLQFPDPLHLSLCPWIWKRIALQVRFRPYVSFRRRCLQI